MRSIVHGGLLEKETTMNIASLVHAHLPHALRLYPTVEQEAAVLERVHDLLPPPPFDEVSVVQRLVQYIVDHDWLDIVLSATPPPTSSLEEPFSMIFVH